MDHNQEYLNFKGGKFSKSRGAAVDVPYFLSKYDPDPLRFYLTATAPETRDTEFSWQDFVERNHNELVATWGNLSQRPRDLGFTLSFATKRFDGQVPEPGAPSRSSAKGLVDEDRALLEKRVAHMEYLTFQAAGWPIGDGAVGSGNKLVVEARLKGSGMHWARNHVNPMLALRNIICSDHWDKAWPQIVRTLHQQERQRRTERRHKRQAAALPLPVAAMLPPEPSPASMTAQKVSRAQRSAGKPARPSAPTEPRRPAAHHP